MTIPRPLRDVFGEHADQLAEDRQAALDEAGHPDLPDALVAEAVVSYADTAPHQVAEHLAPFVTAHSSARHGGPAGTEAELSHGLHLLATVPAGAETDPPAETLAATPVEGDPAGVADTDLDRLEPEHPAVADVTGSPPADASAAAGEPLATPDFGGGAAAGADSAADAAEDAPDRSPAVEDGVPVTASPDDEPFPAADDAPFADIVDEAVTDEADLDDDDPAAL